MSTSALGGAQHLDKEHLVNYLQLEYTLTHFLQMVNCDRRRQLFRCAALKIPKHGVMPKPQTHVEQFMRIVFLHIVERDQKRLSDHRFKLLGGSQQTYPFARSERYKMRIA